MINPKYTIDTPKQQGAQAMVNSSASVLWGSGTVGTPSDPIVFYAAPGAGKIWKVTNIIIHMQQQATETANFELFWRAAAALTNGILFRKARNGILDHYLVADPITTSFEMIMSFPVVRSDIFATSPYTAGDLDISFDWIAEAAGFDLYLDGDKGERVEWVIQDTMPSAGSWYNMAHYEIVKG